MFARRVNYSEIWFCNEYFIADVNILAETPNRKFVKEIDLILSTYVKTFQYRNIKGAKLYEFNISNKKFKIAIAEIELGIYLIAYLSGRDLRISAEADNIDGRKRNKHLLYEFALKNYFDEILELFDIDWLLCTNSHPHFCAYQPNIICPLTVAASNQKAAARSAAAFFTAPAGAF